MIDLFGELERTLKSLSNRHLAISYAIDQEKENLISLGFVPNALQNEDVAILDIPEIAAYYLLAQIAGTDTTQPLPDLLRMYDKWEIMANTTLSKMEKN